MKLEFGHWIVKRDDGLYATSYRPELVTGKIDEQVEANTLIVVKTGCGRQVCRLADLSTTIRFIESGDDYVREVFVMDQK